MAGKITSREQAERIKQYFANSGLNMPEETQKALAEFERKAANQSMSSDKAKEVLAVDPQNAEAQEAVNIANAGYEEQTQPYVTTYTDPTGGKYKFNWQQYAFRDNPELANAKELTPEQIEKIDKSRLEAMYGEADKVNLNKKATDMHFKTANESWTDFMNSDRFAQFKNYMSDVQQYQQDKALNQIWNDGSLSNFATDFTLPVSKAYAREHYNDINSASDMKAALTADAAMNAAMAGGYKYIPKVSSAVTTRLASHPLAAKFAEYAAAPVVGEVGQVAVNDKELSDAAISAAAGTGGNVMAPYVIKGLYGRLTHAKDIAQHIPWKTQAEKATDEAVKAAKAARAAQKKTLTRDSKTGNYIDSVNRIEYIDPEAVKYVREHPLAREGWLYKSKTEMPNKPVVDIPKDESHTFMPEGIARDAANRSLRDIQGMQDKAKIVRSNIMNILRPNSAKPNAGYKPKMRSEEFYNVLPQELGAALREQDERFVKTFDDRVNKILSGKISAADWKSNYNATEAAYRYLGIQPRESLASYLGRQNRIASDYVSNLAGTSPRAKNFTKNTLRSFVPSELYNAEETKKQAEQEQQAATYRLLIKGRK